MIERIVTTISALKIDRELEKKVKSGMLGKYAGQEWGQECVALAKARRTGQIDTSSFDRLSPAAKELLPKELIIK